jgi:hypothetical protein
MVTVCKRFTTGKVKKLDKDIDITGNYPETQLLAMYQKYNPIKDCKIASPNSWWSSTHQCSSWRVRSTGVGLGLPADREDFVCLPAGIVGDIGCTGRISNHVVFQTMSVGHVGVVWTSVDVGWQGRNTKFSNTRNGGIRKKKRTRGGRSRYHVEEKRCVTLSHDRRYGVTVWSGTGVCVSDTQPTMTGVMSE